MRPQPPSDAGAPGATLTMGWAVLGVFILLLQAAVALGARALDTVAAGLTPVEWVVLATLTGLFVYGEGVRAIGGRWVPYVLKRARHLADRPRPVYVALAPLYAMALVGGTRRQVVVAWAGVAAIGGAVLLVRAFPEPWRGITDFAVAAALGWGAAVLLFRAIRGSREWPGSFTA